MQTPSKNIIPTMMTNEVKVCKSFEMGEKAIIDLNLLYHITYDRIFKILCKSPAISRTGDYAQTLCKM